MKNRPYFHSSTSELKATIEHEKGNPDALKAIIKEIGFRKKTKASLAPDLQKAKDYISGEVQTNNSKTASSYDTPDGINVGDQLQGVTLETFVDPETARVRVRPVDGLLGGMRVEFPKGLRAKHPVGTQFSASVKVSQKTNKVSGKPLGRPHLIASPSSIKLLNETLDRDKSGPKRDKKLEPQKHKTGNQPNEATRSDEHEVEAFVDSDDGINDSPATEVQLGKLGTIRKSSNTLKGLPSVWSPKLEETFEVAGLAEAESNSQQFCAALGGLVWEIRRGAKFSKTITLTNGRKEKTHSGEYGYLYAFLYDGDEEFFEGARIDFQTGTKKTKGSIVSMLPGKQRTVVVSLEEDFGKTISSCSITQDEAALLEALQKRFEIELGVADRKSGSPVGMNTDLADMLLEGASEELDPASYEEIDVADLNEDQAAFVQKAIKHSISVLWGPPGTGKTKALGVLNGYFYEMGERTLICSNTNQAVDQVLLKLCEQLIQDGRQHDLEEGKIIRIGRISQTELEEKFGEYVTVDGVAERKSAELTKEVGRLEKEKEKSETQLAKHQNLIEENEELENLERLIKAQEKNSNSLEQKLQACLQERKDQASQIEGLEQEKKNYKQKGFFGKAMSRSPEKIDWDISRIQENVSRAEKKILSITSDLKSLQTNQPENISRIKTIKRHLSGVNIKEIVSLAERAEDKISEINADLTDLKRQLEDMRKTIISEAIVVGATLTKSFLSPSDMDKFHNVVIDEASMGLIPSVYFTASQSNERVVISGDFRQLPPIVQSKNSAIVNIIGGNDNHIFKRSGFEEDFENHVDCDYAQVLRLQYRMDPMICDLISKIGYAGELKTGDRKKINLPAPKKFKSPVIIVDTSPLYPFTDRDPFGSTSNILHALISRNIMKEINKTPKSGTIGYCAPFRAQIKMMKKMVEGENFSDDVAIGTVHTFQGDEKDTIIFDTVNSIGERHFINPNLAQEHASKSNILTVAVSRAKERLIFIANLRYLDTKIPAMGYFRKILYQAQSNGAVIAANEIIDLVPLREELEKAKYDFKELKVKASHLKSGLVNEDVFFPLLKADLNQAKKYIAIYSGFYTASRVNDLIEILQDKVQKGLKVRVIIPPPNRNGSMSETDSKLVYEKMASCGILVEFRAKIHQKVVLIDNDIAWFGSLNPLSFSGGTEESMLRNQQTNITGTFAANLAVNRQAAKDDPSIIADAEIPDCKNCGGKTIFNRGRYGAWVVCMDCENKETLKNF